MKFLVVLLLVGCGEVRGTPFGGELLGSGGGAGGALLGTGGGAAVAGTGGVTASGGSPAAPLAATGGVSGAGGAAQGFDVETLPTCPAYVTEFESPVASSPACGVSADNHLLFGCVGVDRQGYPLDTAPCQFTDPNNVYNDSHVFGCVDVHGC